eukprot:gnl/MRDRNA2_/MRDRNA2_129622_c0_seq1.p1 gnl/MRDRNA2_/MRDRNA2_129622_c0~~gnl/MRDRNA2_/MRDRNA2_129622_c0_seq1.p1  ORF type:complete len:487 (+),score=86.10 gnl/MRDRNA2_/MRDRNA2_129622_c0_seq1:162-1622(+)
MTLEFSVVQAARTAFASGGTADDLEKAIQEAFRIQGYSSSKYDISEDDIQSYEDSYFGGCLSPHPTGLGFAPASEGNGLCEGDGYEDSHFDLPPAFTGDGPSEAYKYGVSLAEGCQSAHLTGYCLPEDDLSEGNVHFPGDSFCKDDGYEDSIFRGCLSPLSKGSGLREGDVASRRDHQGLWMGPLAFLDTEVSNQHRWGCRSHGIWQVEAMGCVKNSFLHFWTWEELRLQSSSLQRCSSCPPGVDVPLQVDSIAEQKAEEACGEDCLEGESTVSILSVSSISVQSLSSVEHVVSTFDDAEAAIHLSNEPSSLFFEDRVNPTGSEIEQRQHVADDVLDWLSLYEEADPQNGFKMSIAFQPSAIKFHTKSVKSLWCLTDVGMSSKFFGSDVDREHHGGRIDCGSKNAGVAVAPPGAMKSSWAVTKDMHQLDERMRTRSYVGDGWFPTQADAQQFKACCSELGDRTDVPDAARWYRHIKSWTPLQRSRW